MTFITSLLLLNYRGDLMSYILIHAMIATPFYISTDNRPSAFRYQCPSATPTWGGGVTYAFVDGQIGIKQEPEVQCGDLYEV